MTRRDYRKRAIEAYCNYLAQKDYTSLGSSISVMPEIIVLGQNIVWGQYISQEMSKFLLDRSNREYIPHTIRSGSHEVIEFLGVVRGSQQRRQQYLAERQEIERGIPIRRRLYLAASQW